MQMCPCAAGWLDAVAPYTGLDCFDQTRQKNLTLAMSFLEVVLIKKLIVVLPC
jgi:hypothetical protein